MHEEGSVWYKRLKKEAEQLSPHVRFIPIKMGFVRIYWDKGGTPAYLHEVYRWMPAKGYDIDEKDPRFDSLKYYEEYEDAATLTLNIKNFVEGYYDSIGVLRKRVRNMKNCKEAYKTYTDAYKEVRVK